ncbi:MAG: sulfotransferase [Alphaproteobacteria bacterium]|nr:sulfotransferase [Alphaproteobacteria bacterium]MDE2630692.1 sulfotransferase [Alphaproteobacteria bacterium]
MSENLDVMLRQAAELREAGKLAEAEAVYERLLARRPDLPDSWYNLALLQRLSGRFDAALASYGQALKRGVSRPEEVHLNCGVIYADHLRRDDAAEREYLAALALNPNYLPALLNLGNLHEDRGRRDEALAVYERILKLDPRSYVALARYANLKTVAGPSDPLIARLKQTIAMGGANAADRASLTFALGKLLDGCGAYDDAFNTYVSANRYSRESAVTRGALYDRRQQEEYVDQLVETFAHGGIGGAASTSSRPPVFICGMFRSGSTLVEQVLASHPRVTAGGEIDFLPGCVQSELAPFPVAMKQMAPATLDGLAARYRDRIAALFPGADLVTDKRPDNYLYIGLIKSLFPDAKIVHTTRHPLDNCLSIYFLHLDHSMGYALDLADTAHCYRQYRRLMAHWKSCFGADILDFDYDAFVGEPRPAVERLLAFCGLDWDDACLSFHRAKNTVKTASVWQVREPLYRRSSGRWRHYEKHLAPLRTQLGDLLPE